MPSLPVALSPVERRVARFEERLERSEEKASEHASAIGELNHAYGRLLGELSSVKGDLSDLKASSERIEQRMWERASGAIAVPSSAPRASDARTGIMLSIIVALVTTLAEVVKFALHVH